MADSGWAEDAICAVKHALGAPASCQLTVTCQFLIVLNDLVAQPPSKWVALQDRDLCQQLCRAPALPGRERVCQPNHCGNTQGYPSSCIADSVMTLASRVV